MSGKGRALQNRLVINPDEQVAPGPRAEPPAPAPAAVEPEPAEEAPAAEEAPGEDEAPEPAAEPASAPSRPRARARKPRAATPPVVLATEDPNYPQEINDYRSFYLANEVYARYRAAIFWASRNPEAMGLVPENMSQGVQQLMLEAAEDLEQRYNDGQVFRMPPPPKRRKKRE